MQEIISLMDTPNKTSGFNWEYFNEVPIVGIFRNIPMDDIVHILPLCVSHGLRTLEITMNTKGAGDIIRYGIENFGTQLNIGAGTVCNIQDLEEAIGYGASFIVTPNLDEEVVSECVKRAIPIFPGAFTPTEIYSAWKLGASMVKVFPADNLGAKFISNIRAPFGEIKLLPTGGIDASNVHDYLKAGASGVGVSSGLFDKKLIRNKDWQALACHLKTFVAAFK